MDKQRRTISTESNQGSFYIPDMRSLASYPQLAGELFETVQLAGIFDDSKTFVDAIPDSEGEVLTRMGGPHFTGWQS